MSIFQRAMEENDDSGNLDTKTMKNGSINYVAMIEKDKEEEVRLQYR